MRPEAPHLFCTYHC